MTLTLERAAHAPQSARMESIDQQRHEAVARRDATFDGAFVYAVKTTGVYCRPSCPSRGAKRENVGFHATPAEARAAGFRACLRCRPDDAPRGAAHAGIVAEACRRIEAADTPPSLVRLAQAAGVSAFHFHRLFKAATGLTPKAYSDAVRAGRFRSALQEAGSVTEAIYDAGFNASSRAYEQAGAMLGMTPGAYRAGGADEAVRFAVAETALGALLVAASAKGVCAIALGDDADALVRDLQDRFPKARLDGADETFQATVARVVALIEQPAKGLDLPLDLRGTAFQQRVWAALTRIPAGETTTYAALAAAIGAPAAVRAVAGACAANKLAVAVPCHRVVRSDGSLSGYRWGVERKRSLLAREAKI